MEATSPHQSRNSSQSTKSTKRSATVTASEDIELSTEKIVETTRKLNELKVAHNILLAGMF